MTATQEPERKPNVKNSKRKPFTLVEIVVVIVIMVLVGTIAVLAVRSESMTILLKRTSNEFRSLCSRARFKAMESGQDRMIVYDPEKRMFYMARPPANEEERNEYDEGFVIMREVKWEMPDAFELTTEDNAPLEVFRFYPDGGASGQWRLNLASKDNDFGIVIEVARLTGAVTVRERERGEE